MRFAGEIAALGAAVCWGCGSNFFVAAGRRIGSRRLNRLRITAAAAMLCATLWIWKGAPWPGWAAPRDAALLAASGLAGFVFGDAFYFRALVILGAGLTALLASTAAIFTAIVARVVLHEHLGPRALAGIALTLGGLAWVLTQRRALQADHPEGSRAVGIACGITSALGSSVGYLLSRQGLQGGLDPLSGTVIRACAATLGIWLLAPWQGGFRHSFDALGDRIAMRAMLGGAVFGPYLGVTLSLVALQRTPAGVAVALLASHPLFAMLVAARVHGEPLGPRTLLGTAVTLGGVALLLLR